MTHMEKQCSLIKDEWMNKPLALTSVTVASSNSELAAPSAKDVKVTSHDMFISNCGGHRSGTKATSWPSSWATHTAWR